MTAYTRRTAFLSLLLLSFSADADPVVNAQGILTGAAGVEVGGLVYDVEFLDGTCVELYSGCDEDSDFPFDVETAFVAQEQLLNAVIQDTPNVGNFSSDPSLVAGCETATSFCQLFLPTRIRDDRGANDNDDIAISGISNNGQAASDFVFGTASFSTFDTTQFSFVFVRWTRVTTEPPQEPPAEPEAGSVVLDPAILRRVADED